MATAMKRQNLRRNMEGQNGGGGGGEVRRVHVLYFLSRNGAIEQPHLIRVHHLHRTGVHLRDVKRWLSDLRGKDMPDSYAWSYKRRYKSGYVWQDLMDDDLITPISDNEYVLKGSEISPKSDLHPLDTSSNDDEDEAAKHAPNLEHSPLLLIQVETDKGLSPKSPPDPDQDSPGAPPPPSCSEGSDKSAKCASKIINGHLWDQQVELKKAESKEKDNEHAKEKEEWRSLDGNHKNRSNGCNTANWWSGRKTSNLLRNLFRCHEAETNDASLFKIQRRERYQSMSGGSYRRGTVADIFGDENLGNRRSFANDSR